ncbi:hypothetical protein [Noviherbaspirillum suwonense]|nr:hypothetical protein [Noviherbaspirillum suwonense]
MAEIAGASIGQCAGTALINLAIAQTDQVTGQNAVLLEAAAAVIFPVRRAFEGRSDRNWPTAVPARTGKNDLRQSFVIPGRAQRDISYISDEGNDMSGPQLKEET